MIWVQLAILVISAVLTYALTPKPQSPAPDQLSDVSVPTIEIGKPVSVAFGEVWVDDSNILWYGDLSSQGFSPPGGKGGGGSFT
jgi:hypothetical protein